jgi:integrase/recombinase XerD
MSRNPMEINSIDDIFEDFIVYLKAVERLSDNTVTSYSYDIKMLKKFLIKNNIKDLSNIKPSILDNYFLEISKKHNYSKSSIARMYSSVHKFIKYLMDIDILEKDPLAKTLRPNIKRNFPKAISLEKIEDLLKQPYNLLEELKNENNLTYKRNELLLRNGAMLELTYSAGLRASEIVNLKTGDIDFVIGMIRIRGKGDKERIVPLGKIAEEKIKKYLTISENKNSDNYLFTNNNKPISRIRFWQIIKNYAKRIGISEEVSPHTLRHSFATHLLDRGADIALIQALLGHSKPSTTEIYTKVDRDRLKKAIDEFHPGA